MIHLIKHHRLLRNPPCHFPTHQQLLPTDRGPRRTRLVVSLVPGSPDTLQVGLSVHGGSCSKTHISVAPCLGPTGLWVLRWQPASCPSTQLRWNHTLSYFLFVSFFPKTLNVFKYLSYLKKHLPSLLFLTLYVHPVCAPPQVSCPSVPPAPCAPPALPLPSQGSAPRPVSPPAPSSHPRATPKNARTPGPRCRSDSVAAAA